jgi:hypothetical protein
MRIREVPFEVFLPAELVPHSSHLYAISAATDARLRGDGG